jgi:hypothetical protein
MLLNLEVWHRIFIKRDQVEGVLERARQPVGD